MLRPNCFSVHTISAPRRQGVVLLIVIALLALFASVGLSFVFYAEAEATASTLASDAATLASADLEPELLLSYFLGQLIYDTNDPYSALRGHGLARGVYGYNPAGKNDQAFNGAGRQRYQLTHPKTGVPADNYNLINYMVHAIDGFQRNPEYYHFKTDPNHKYVGESGVPWTYPDLHNPFLAAVNKDGEILIQSYNRPETGVTFDPKDPNYGNGWQKYLTLRPHPSYHPNFILPDADGGGDVKNLDWGRGVPYWDSLNNVKKYYNNDSYWLDLGYPVTMAADGRKYKVLFAPLIVDLDNRVNLWAAGGLQANVQRSNQGWGRWEINPKQIMLPANQGEYPNLFLGANGVAGRYGPNNVPEGTRSPLMAAALWYNNFDFDGNAAGPIALPAAGSLLGFPTYPANWDSANTAELTAHPWNYNYLNPAPNDIRRLPASNMEAMLRLGGKGSTGFNSDIFKLLPINMKDSRTRNLSTLLSFDFNKPGLVPWYTQDPGANSTFAYDPTRAFPASTPVPFPSADPLLPPGPPAVNSEFGGEWRSRLAALQRINLNRTLRDYPKSVYQDPTDPTNLALQRLQVLDTTSGPVMTQFAQAQSDRQQFALDIYKMLLQVTGAMDPNVVSIPKADPKFKAARWLAQLAVNMVDYIDTDEISTPFLWYKDPTNQADVTQWETAFGIELPRLVINEAYAQYDNDPLDPGFDPTDMTTWLASKYKFNCWVELHNPFKDTPGGDVQSFPLDRGEAQLKIFDANNVGTVAYRLVITQPDPKVRDFDTPLWTPDPAKQILILDDWTGNANQQRVLPGNGYYAVQNGSNRGFFVVGPTMAQYANMPFKDRNPNLPTTWATDKMSASYLAKDPNQPMTEYAVVLQRLACPYLPLDNNPASPAYNPYITVDMMDGNALAWQGYYDGRFYDTTGVLAVAPKLPTEFSSRGRRQPYAGNVNLYSLQNPNTQAANQPKHTFFRHNAREDANINPMTGVDQTTVPSAATPMQTLNTPFNWLLHLDRQLINPMELLHVSGHRPYNLTQRFLDDAGVPYKHSAPWLAPDTLLYRFLEMAYTPDLINGCSEGGRTPGKLNINTLWDRETFRALCDPQTGNGFNLAQVDAIYDRMVASRTPTTFPDGTRLPGGTDRPFWPFGIGYTAPGTQYPSGLSSLQQSLFREDAPGKNIFINPVPGSHPYQDYELLTRMHNNVTTRSNCFAVYLTVGFFEVVDDTARPVKLGKEIGRDEGRHIRHRMFAVIDRTQLQMRTVFANGAPLEFSLANAIPAPPPGQTIIDKLSMPLGVNTLTFDTITGKKWTIVPGTTLVIGPDTPNEETVTVTSVMDPGNPASFAFICTKGHLAGERVISRSNMGPWTRYDPRNDSKVVPYFSVID